MFLAEEEDGAIIEVCALVSQGILERDVVATLQTTDGSATCEKAYRLGLGLGLGLRLGLGLGLRLGLDRATHRTPDYNSLNAPVIFL